MNRARTALSLIAAVGLVATTAAMGSTASAAPQPSGGTASLARSLGADSPDHVRVTRTPGTSLVRFIGTTPGHPLARPAGLAANATPPDVARAFLSAHADLFGIPDAAHDIAFQRSQAAPGGHAVERFDQLVAGHPVVGGQLVVTLTSDRRISYVSAETVPGAKVASQLEPARLTAQQARVVALAATAKGERLARRSLTAGPASLAVYVPSVLGVPTAAPTSLVYRVEVDSSPASSRTVRELVFVDAAKGVPALQFNQVAEAVSRTVCSAADNASITDPTCPGGASATVRTEGQPATGDTDTDNAYDYAGDTYNFYATVVGNTSTVGVPSGSNRALYSTVHLCDPSSTGGICTPFENAFWDGHEMVYGDGFASADDVVAHELTHGVTQHTSDLMYLYQSGAINESMSDVMGELTDQWANAGINDGETYRWMLGEDLPASFGVIRDMKDPTTPPSGVPTPNFFPQPDKMTSSLYFGDLADDPNTGQAYPVDNGGVHINSGVGNKAAYLIVDGATFNGVTVPGLGGATPATRTAAITKAAKIYYLTDQTLTSGADYLDLASVLPAACDTLVGTAGITTTDCTTVRDAVKATEMTKQPPVAGTPQAPGCTTATSTDFYDNLENTSSGRWAKSAGTGPWYYPAANNPYGPGVPTEYATSGTQEFWADDPDPTSAPFTPTLDGTIAMTGNVRVPVGKTMYLTFNHAFLFEWYRSAVTGGAPLFVDGGRVEYSTDSGAHWTSAAKLFDFGGYNATMHGFDTASPPNQIYTFQGFGGDSHGYVSSRLNLASLAGKAVRFRFRMTADKSVGAYGWYVDDVRFFTCGAKPAAPAPAKLAPGLGRVTVSWTLPADHGTSAIKSYTVVVKTGTTTLKTVTASASARSATVSGLPSGKSLTATVAAVNSAGAGPATTTNTLTGTKVTAALSGTTLKGRLLKAGTSTGLGGRTVALYQRKIGTTAWSLLTSKKTSTSGTVGSYSFGSLGHGKQYQVRFAGATPYQGSQSVIVKLS